MRELSELIGRWTICSEFSPTYQKLWSTIMEGHCPGFLHGWPHVKGLGAESVVIVHLSSTKVIDIAG
jgi:hypothetical protein